MPGKDLIPYLLFIFFIFIFSCSEPFFPDIRKSELSSMLVVEGMVTDEEGPFRVKLTRPFQINDIRNVRSACHRSKCANLR